MKDDDAPDLKLAALPDIKVAKDKPAEGEKGKPVDGSDTTAILDLILSGFIWHFLICSIPCLARSRKRKQILLIFMLL